MRLDSKQTLAALRRRVGRLEADRATGVAALGFGFAALDGHLPGGGLRLGALHEVGNGSGTGGGMEGGALAVLFAGALLARLDGPVLWCLARGAPFAPGLAAVGLHPDRVVYASAGTSGAVHQAMEEGLRCRGLAGVVGEVGRIGLTGSRRLQLAAEGSGALVLALCDPGAVENEPSAAFTRWRIGPSPSPAPPIPGLLRARWSVALIRARGAPPRSWILEAPDAQGRLALPADLADGSLAPPARRAAAG